MIEPQTAEYQPTLREAVGTALSIIRVIMPESAPCHHDRRWLLSVLSDVDEAYQREASPDPNFCAYECPYNRAAHEAGIADHPFEAQP